MLLIIVVMMGDLLLFFNILYLKIYLIEMNNSFSFRKWI